MSLSGRLLVATPLIADPNFERTVVLLLAHGQLPHIGLRIYMQTVLLFQLHQAFFHHVQVEHESARRFQPQSHVFQHG